MIEAISAFSGISVDDIKKARAFYVDTLQLSVKDDSMGLTLELPGGGGLFIYEKTGHEPASFTVLNFVVKDIKETVAHLAGHHGIIFEHYDSMPAEQDEQGILWGKEAGYGPNIAWFKDPAGNILAVLEN